jgi:lipoate-protein ligase A
VATDERRLLVFLDPPLDGPTNMARDEHLLHAEDIAPGAVRIYAWDPPTLSLGYFQQYDELAKLPTAARGLAVVRRLTGGGAILHDREVTYSVVLDDSVSMARKSPAELYRVAHACWRDAIAVDGRQSELAPDEFPLPSPRTGPFFCFEKPGRTDLIVGGQKLLGSAQRRVPGKVMQHGSLILGKRYSMHPGTHLNDPPVELVRRWSDLFVACFSAAVGLAVKRAEWTAERLADVERRRARYVDEEFLRRR